MSNSLKKIARIKDQVRCVSCDKLFAKIVHEHFEIKCVRCGTINNIFGKMIKQLTVTKPNRKSINKNKIVKK